MILKRLAELRTSHSLTQQDLADLLGVARTTYAMYEQGKNQMDYSTLVRVADYFKVSLDYLFERTDNPLHANSYTPDEFEFMMRSLDVYMDLKQNHFTR